MLAGRVGLARLFDLAQGRSQRSCSIVMRGAWIAAGGSRWEIFFVHADVKAGLLELLFHVNLALLHEGQKVAAQPGDLGEGETVLGDVDGLAGKVRRRRVAFRRSRVAIDMHQMLLEFDRPDGGVDLERGMEVRVVGAGQRGEKLSSPGAAVAAIHGEALIDLQSVAGGEGDEEPLIAHVHKVFLALNTIEAIAVSYFILVDQYFVRALERRRNDEAAALVVEGRQDNRG